MALPLRSDQAFNAKPTGPDQPLRFRMAHPLRSFHPQRFIHQKLHGIRTKMLKHLHCKARRTRSAVEVQHGSSPQAFHEADWTRSAVEVQHGSFPQAISPTPLHPSEALPTLDKKHGQCEARRGRSAVEVQHGSSPPEQISR